MLPTCAMLQEEEVARDNAIKNLASQNAGQRRVNFCRRYAAKPSRTCPILHRVWPSHRFPLPQHHRKPTSRELRNRLCYRCQAWKPPRAHHCSVLGTCVLKLDHFCLWVVNSVGLLNYKAFLLFIGYSTLACIETAVVLLPIAIQAIAKSDNSMCAAPSVTSRAPSHGHATPNRNQRALPPALLPVKLDIFQLPSIGSAALHGLGTL